MAQKEDEALIALVLKGETSAFSELIDKYKDRLFRTLYRMLGNIEDTQDVMQDAFLFSFAFLSRFKKKSRFYSWLYRIAVNKAINLKRRQSVYRHFDNGEEDTVRFDPQDVSVWSNPSFELEREEDEYRIQQALEFLSPKDRAILLMKIVEGMKYKDISRCLKIPIGTVRSRLHRARLRLHGILHEEHAKSV